jgi:hypothetical protein
MKNPSRFIRRSAAPALPILLAGALEAADITGLVKELFPVPSTTGNEDQLGRKVHAALPVSVHL